MNKYCKLIFVNVSHRTLGKYRRRGKFVDRLSIGSRRLAGGGGVIHAIRRMVHELSSRSVWLWRLFIVKNGTNFVSCVFPVLGRLASSFRVI